MSDLSPMWIAVVVSVFNLVGSAIAIYVGLKSAIAEIKAQQISQGLHIGHLQDDARRQGSILADHQTRIAVLEHAVDVRQQPPDYPVHG
jgi:hypothetical protein